MAADEIARIVELAERAAAEVAKLDSTIDDMPSGIRTTRALINEADRIGSHTATLIEAVKKFDALGLMRGGWIQLVSMGMAIQPTSTAFYLIRQALDGNSVSKAVDALCELAKSRRCGFTLYAPISGASIEKARMLSKSLALIPWSDVPNGPQKSEFERTQGTRIFEMLRPPATAAIRFHLSDKQVLFASSDDAGGDTLAAGMEAMTTELGDVVHAIASLGHSPVVLLGSWDEIESDALAKMSGQGTMYFAASLERNHHLAVRNPSNIDAEQLTQIFGRWHALAKSDQVVLRVALSRLNQASRRMDIVDKALDLGIALEVMLLHGGGDQSELSFRLSSRGATFMSGGHTQRVSHYNLLRDAYRLRSKAAHRGVLPASLGTRTVADILNDAAALTAEIAKRLIERGGFPNDWEIEYVLGGS